MGNLNQSVTVLVFFHNHGHTLAKTLRSLLLNSNLQLEVVLVILAAEDTTSKEVLLELEINPLPKTSILKGNFWNITEAYLSGIEKAKGDYTLGIWADSLLPDNYCTTLLQTIATQTDCRFAFSQFALYGETTRNIPTKDYSLVQALQDSSFTIPVCLVHTQTLSSLCKGLIPSETSLQTLWAILSIHGYTGLHTEKATIYLNANTFYRFQTNEILTRQQLLNLPTNLKEKAEAQILALLVGS